MTVSHWGLAWVWSDNPEMITCITDNSVKDEAHTVKKVEAKEKSSSNEKKSVEDKGLVTHFFGLKGLSAENFYCLKSCPLPH